MTRPPVLLKDLFQQVAAAAAARLAALATRRPIARQHHHKSHARKFTALWGERRVDDLTRFELREWVERRRLEVSDATVRHEVSFLSKCFRQLLELSDELRDRGEDPGHQLVRNPCSGLFKGLAKSPIVPLFLRPEEQAALEQACDPWAYTIIEFGVLTGLRPFELFCLRPEHVDLEAALLLVQDGKTGSRQVPLHPHAATIAEVWMERHPGEWLFYPDQLDRTRMGQWFRQNRLLPAAKKAGIRKITPRALRHTFASRLVQGGESLFVVQRLLGHSTPDQTQRYAVLGTNDLRQAVGRLAGGS